MIFYAHYDQGRSCKSLFNERRWFLIHNMMKKHPACLSSIREYEFLCILWSRNVQQVFVQWENMIFYAHYDQGMFNKSLFNERILFFIHIMMKKDPACLSSIKEYEFLCILWSRNVQQVFVQWENMIFYAHNDEEISCKSLFNERIWFFMHIMIKECSISLCSMREYYFSFILWWRKILHALVQ
jgi:hypothetical protein